VAVAGPAKPIRTNTGILPPPLLLLLLALLPDVLDVRLMH
jgi:hypothetical protein